VRGHCGISFRAKASIDALCEILAYQLLNQSINQSILTEKLTNAADQLTGNKYLNQNKIQRRIKSILY